MLPEPGWGLEALAGWVPATVTQVLRRGLRGVRASYVTPLGSRAGAPGSRVEVGRVTPIAMVTGPSCPFACSHMRSCPLHTWAPGCPVGLQALENLSTLSLSVACGQDPFLLFAAKISEGHRYMYLSGICEYISFSTTPQSNTFLG